MKGLLGIDIGGSKFAVSDGVADTVADWPRPPADDAERAVRADVDALVAALPGTEVRRVGIASAAEVDRDGRVVSWPNRPWWRGVPLTERIEAATGGAVSVLDDGAAAAAAEARAADVEDLVYLGIGTGLAGGAVVGGRLLTGSARPAFQVGHLQLLADPLPCRCGRSRCLQSLVSGPGITRLAAARRGQPVRTLELPAAVDAGLPWATTAIADAAAALGGLCALLAEVLGPSRIHIGGGLGAALPDIASRTSEAMVDVLGSAHLAPSVAPAALGRRAPLAGALLLAEHGDALAEDVRSSHDGPVGGARRTSPSRR